MKMLNKQQSVVLYVIKGGDFVKKIELFQVVHIFFKTLTEKLFFIP